MSDDEEIAAVFYQDIQDKTNLVKNKSGLLPFLDAYNTYDPDDSESLNGYDVSNLLRGITNSEDRKLLENLYFQVLEEERLEKEKEEAEE